MVGGGKLTPSEAVKEFVLVPKREYQARHATDIPTVLPNTISPPAATAPITTTSEQTTPASQGEGYSVVSKEVFAQLEAITGTKQCDNKTWRAYKTILQAILDSPILDIQLHNLEITVNGQPVAELKASTLIHNLTRHNKKLAPTKYLHVLPHLVSLSHLGAVSNKFAKEFWATLNGTSEQQKGRGKKEKHQASSSRVKKANRPSSSPNNRSKQATAWISF